MVGKARVVEDELGRGRGAGGECRLLPVAADDQQSFGGRRERGGQAFKKALRWLPGIGRSPGPVHEKAGSASVRDKDCGLALRVSGHGVPPGIPAGRLEPGR